MELDRSDMKRRTVSSSILEEDSISPPLVKRTKVQAQRKFAQGSTTIQVAPTTSTGQFTSYNERYKKAPPVQRKFNPDDYDINEITHPKTEDFITFLCFRDTEFLPPRLNFFNVPQQYINKVTKNKPDQNFTEKIPAKKTTVKGDQKTTVKGDQKKKVPPKGNKKGKAGRPTAMVTQTTSVGKNVTKKRLSNNNASNNRSAVETRLRPKTTSKRSKDVKASTSLKKYKSESEDDIFSSDTCSSDTESDSSISNQIRRNPSRNVKHNMKNEFTRITRSNKGRSDDIEVEDSRRTGSLPNKKVNQKNTSTSLRNKQNAASGPKSGNPLGCFNENDDAQVLKNTRRNSKKSSVSISEGTAVCLLNKLQVPTTDTIRIDSNFSSNMEKSGNRKVPKISKETIDRQQIMGENEHDSPRKLRSESERICKKIRENELLSQRNEKPKLINKNELNEIDSTKSVEKMELKDNCSSKLVKNLKKSNTVKKDKLSVSTSCNVILKKQGCSSTKSDDNHKSVIGLTQESKTSLMENNDKDDEMEKLVEVKKHLAPSEAMSESCRKNSTHTDRKKSSKACRKSGTCGNASRQQFESLNPRSVKGRVSVSSQPSASSEVNINKVDSQSKSSDYPELGKTPDNAVSNANELAKKIAIIARDEIVKNANIGNRRDSSSDSNKSQGSVCYTEKSSTLMETTESTKTKGVSSGNKTIASSNSAATSSKNVAGNSGRHLSFYKSYLSAYGEKNVKPQQAKSEISKPTNMSRDKHPKCYSKKINLPPLNETESTKNDTSASSVKRLWLNKEKHFDAFTQTDSLTTNSVKYTFTDNVKASTSENSYLKPKNIKEREHLRKSTIGETSDKSSALQLLERKDEELSNINDDDKTKKVENNSRDVTDTDYDGSQDNVKSNDSGARTSVNGNTTKIDEKSKTSKEFEHNGELLEAPTFYPTEEEFQDPMEYINNVCSVAERYGLCRIVPPSTFKPECKVTDEMRFMAYNQYVHKMLNRWGPNVKEVMAIKKYLATQSVTFTHSPWIGGVEVDLSRLYQTVQQCGGLKEVMEEEKWHNVADLLKIPKLAKDGITKLDDIYCKYLLPYDTLSPNERKKLFEQVEKEWKIHDKYECVDDNCIFDDAEECIAKGRTMPLSCFYRIARNTMMMWLDDDSSTEQVEGEFWKHVSSRNCHVCVNSGSIDSGPNGYGFPVNKTSTLAKHPWNLKILTNNSSSILRYLGPIIGVTVPTLHMGMLYSACCWYRDPHGLPWIEYLHTGASKIWYGIPDEYSAEFKNAIGTLAPRYCRDKKIWLSSDTVMIPPAMLVEKNVYLSRVVQHPGQFIVVFPKSFTSNISTGYLVSESVYFAHPSWLDTAAEVFNDMQESCEPPVFSLEQLLINISNDLRCDLKVLVKILPMLNNVKNNEIKYRNKLVQIGLSVKRNATCNKRSRQKSTQDNNEMQECESCGVCLFISSVVNSTEQTNYCLKDGLEYLTENRNDIENCKLMYTYAEDELENLIVKVQERIQVKSNKSRACK